MNYKSIFIYLTGKFFFGFTSLKFLLIAGCFLSFSGKSYAQFYAVKSDLVGLATGTLNVEPSAVIGMKWSVHAPLQYNPWTYGDNKKMKHLTFQPGVRYWFNQTYGYGWFLGMNALVSHYNVGGVFGIDRRYQGMAYGAGFSGGFNLPLAKLWNLEFELGAGAIYTSYDKYTCVRCGDKLGDGSGFYAIPTKFAVSLVYLF